MVNNIFRNNRYASFTTTATQLGGQTQKMPDKPVALATPPPSGRGARSVLGRGGPNPKLTP